MLPSISTRRTVTPGSAESSKKVFASSSDTAKEIIPSTAPLCSSVPLLPIICTAFCV